MILSVIYSACRHLTTNGSDICGRLIFKSGSRGQLFCNLAPGGEHALLAVVAEILGRVHLLQELVRAGVGLHPLEGLEDGPIKGLPLIFALQARVAESSTVLRRLGPVRSWGCPPKPRSPPQKQRLALGLRSPDID